MRRSRPQALTRTRHSDGSNGRSNWLCPIPSPTSTIEIGHIRMLALQGHDILANGNFSRGTERWYFTDDQHLVWRIENQYLMSRSRAARWVWPHSSC